MGKGQAAILVAVACGCGSYSTYKTTRIASPGATEFLFGAQVSGAQTVGPGEGGSTTQHAAPLPELSIGARRGFRERYEVQLNGTLLPLKQAQTGSIELAGKVRLVEHGRWSLATGLGVGYRIADAGGGIVEAAYASIPVIGGIDLGRHQLVVSVTAGDQKWYASGARPVDVPFVGGSLGFLWQLGRSWALLPEAGTAWSPTPNFMTDNTRLFYLGVAALFTH